MLPVTVVSKRMTGAASSVVGLGTVAPILVANGERPPRAHHNCIVPGRFGSFAVLCERIEAFSCRTFVVRLIVDRFQVDDSHSR